MTDNLQETIPATQPGTRPAQNGTRPQGGPPAQRPDGAKPRGRRIPMALVLPILLIVLAAGGYFGYQYWYNQTYFVYTDNAEVSGDLIQVGSLNAGRVDSLSVDVGSKVQAGEKIGSVLLPSTLSMTQNGTPVMGFVGSENQRANVVATASGVVVARDANVGDIVAQGQPVVTIVDPSKLWILANIDETSIGQVKVGQPVNVDVDSLGKTLPGKVIAVNRASANTFSLLPSTNYSGSFTKVTQWVPVKISIDAGNEPLVLGSSVEVHIRIKE